MQQPLEIKLTSHVNAEWLQRLRWLNPAHYELAVGAGDLRTNCRATVNGRFLFHLIPSALSATERQEMFRLALAVARNKAKDTRRIRNVGGGEHSLTKAGTRSLFARARPLKVLRNAKEGTFGFEGVRRLGNSCCPCAFNREQPDEYRQLVPHCESLSDLAREHEPELWQRHMDLILAHRSRMIGESIWPQGVSNLCFAMTAHSDSGNVPGSMSAMIVAGDFAGGELILPAYSAAVFVKPGDLLLFDGRELHGVGPFKGVRLSVVLYLKSSVLECPCAASASVGEEPAVLSIDSPFPAGSMAPQKCSEVMAVPQPCDSLRRPSQVTQEKMGKSAMKDLLDEREQLQNRCLEALEVGDVLEAELAFHEFVDIINPETLAAWPDWSLQPLLIAIVLMGSLETRASELLRNELAVRGMNLEAA